MSVQIQSSPRNGFNIIEMCIAICLIGLVLVMALKGTVLIEMMKAKMVGFELQQFQLKVQRHIEDYRKYPGDNPHGERLWSRVPALTLTGQGVLVSLQDNNRIDGQLFQVSNPDGEQFAAWRDLRFAGMVDGDTSLQGASALPENPFGGFYGFDEGNLGQKNGSLCATKIPGRAAEAIDKKIDDGRINTGRLVATSKFSIEENNHFDAPDSEPYNIEKEYIICVPLLP